MNGREQFIRDGYAIIEQVLPAQELGSLTDFVFAPHEPPPGLKWPAA